MICASVKFISNINFCIYLCCIYGLPPWRVRFACKGIACLWYKGVMLRVQAGDSSERCAARWCCNELAIFDQDLEFLQAVE